VFDRVDIEVYKIVHGLSAIPFTYLFELDNSGRTRGHSLKLQNKRCRLDLARGRQLHCELYAVGLSG